MNLDTPSNASCSWFNKVNWADSIFSVEQCVQWMDDAYSLNIVGRQAQTVRHLLLQHLPQLKIRAICPIIEKEKALFSNTDDVYFIFANDIGNYLLPRSRTIILDPYLAQWMMAQKHIIKKLSFSTFEWVLVPHFIESESFYCLYSEEFSCEEPLRNDKAKERWIWTTSPNAATVSIINLRKNEKYSLSFALQTENPGTFTIDFLGTQQKITFNKAPFYKEIFYVKTLDRVNHLKIKFDGLPVKPSNSLDTRKELYFCLKNLKLKPFSILSRYKKFFPISKNKTTILNDRAVRNFFHQHGFFEIKSFDTNNEELTPLKGFRSCFDYREGFTLRDYKSSASEKVASQHNTKLPVMWYQLRKTPTPFSEF